MIVALVITAVALFLLWLLVKHIQFRIYRRLDIWNQNRGDYISFYGRDKGDSHERPQATTRRTY